jgi:hypothetical protein
MHWIDALSHQKVKVHVVMLHVKQNRRSVAVDNLRRRRADMPTRRGLLAGLLGLLGLGGAARPAGEAGAIASASPVADDAAGWLEIVEWGGEVRWSRTYVPGALPAWLLAFGRETMIYEALERIDVRLETGGGTPGEKSLRLDFDGDDEGADVLAVALVALGTLAPIVVGQGQRAAISYDAEHARIVLRGEPRHRVPAAGV